MRKTRDDPHADQLALQEAIERKGAELRSLGLSEEEIKRATDPLRSFYLDGEHSIAAPVGSRRP